MKGATQLEVVQPPIPAAALLARPVQSPANEGLAREVADLRELVKRLASEVKELQAIVGRTATVCCICGKSDCYEAPHVPMKYWQRYGPGNSYDRYRYDDPEGAHRAVHEHFMRGRAQSARVFDDRALEFRQTTNYEKGWR